MARIFRIFAAAVMTLLIFYLGLKIYEIYMESKDFFDMVNQNTTATTILLAFPLSIAAKLILKFFRQKSKNK